MSRYSRYPAFNDLHPNPPNAASTTHESLVASVARHTYHPPHEIQASVEPEQRPRGVQLVDAPVQIHHPHLHEEFTEISDNELSDDNDERQLEDRRGKEEVRPSRSRSSQSRGSHSAPYMGRAPTPYHPPETESHQLSDSHPHPERAPEQPLPLNVPPTSHQVTTSERMPRAPVDRMLSSSRDAQSSQYQHTAYGPSAQPMRVPSGSTHYRDHAHAAPLKHRSQPSYPHGFDANTYCYIVPRGTNVIFQDEDGYEITRIGQFQRPSNRSEENMAQDSPTRKRTVPIVVQDEFGQELYRTGSITHGYDELGYRRVERHHGSHRGRSRSMSNFPSHTSQAGFLPYAHAGPNIVLVDRNGHQIPIATNPYRTTREVRSEDYY